jgi:hypothetical protein
MPLLCMRTKRAEKLNLFFYATIAFLLINAAVCSTFAGVSTIATKAAWRGSCRFV